MYIRVFIFILVTFVSIPVSAASVVVPVDVFNKIKALETVTSIDQILSPVAHDISPLFSQGKCPVSADTESILTDSYFLQVIHKASGIPENYIPPNLVDIQPELKQSNKKDLVCITESTAVHFKQMTEEMAKQKLYLNILSGYRSFADQTYLLKEKGKEYNKGVYDRAAVPGFSEHQLGTAIDVTSLTKSGTAFAKTPESAWLRAHAHEYGFIISYGDLSEYKTGYMSEPWHLRFVGVENALLLKAGNYSLAHIAGFYRPVYVLKFLQAIKKNISI